MHTPLSGKLGRALPALLVRGSGLGLQIGVNIVIARLFGAEGMGLYTLYVTWLMLFTDLVSIGMPVYVMRTVAALKARAMEASTRAFVLKALSFALSLGGLILLLPWLAAAPLALWLAGDETLSAAFRVAAVGAWLFVGLRILVESLKAVGATNRGLFAESATIPLVILALLPASFLIGEANSETLLWIHVLATAVAFSLAAVFWQRLNRDPKGAAKSVPVYSPALWPLWGGMLLNVLYVNLPVLLLPRFVDMAELGQFGVAFRLMNLVTVILVTLAAIFGPKFAAAYATGDSAKLRLHLKRSQQFSLLLFTPLLLTFTLFAGPVLSLFGEEFKAAAPLLWILALGQLVNAATGLVGYLLNMMHQERTEFAILLGTGISMFVGMIVAGKYGGVMGVTLVYSVGLMLKNLLSLGFSIRHLRHIQRTAS